LGLRFGIAPADRGLVAHGPYRLVRHPMYLGELVLRLALVSVSPQLFLAAGLFALLAAIQVWRAMCEERIIQGYPRYAVQVRYRLIPLVW
jgi:protein-S-isoprenylcysteine O-methyltransferase Ste14